MLTACTATVSVVWSWSWASTVDDRSSSTDEVPFSIGQISSIVTSSSSTVATSPMGDTSSPTSDISFSTFPSSSSSSPHFPSLILTVSSRMSQRRLSSGDTFSSGFVHCLSSATATVVSFTVLCDVSSPSSGFGVPPPSTVVLRSSCHRLPLSSCVLRRSSSPTGLPLSASHRFFPSSDLHCLSSPRDTSRSESHRLLSFTL